MHNPCGVATKHNRYYVTVCYREEISQNVLQESQLDIGSEPLDRLPCMLHMPMATWSMRNLPPPTSFQPCCMECYYCHYKGHVHMHKAGPCMTLSMRKLYNGILITACPHLLYITDRKLLVVYVHSSSKNHCMVYNYV